MTDDGIILSKTKASHLGLYSYLSRESLVTSITMFNSSGGLFPAGISFHKFMLVFHLQKAKNNPTDLSFLRKFGRVTLDILIYHLCFGYTINRMLPNLKIVISKR
jgi:hypothetical protein